MRKQCFQYLQKDALNREVRKTIGRLKDTSKVKLMYKYVFVIKLL